MNNLATLLTESARADADRVAVRQDEIALTYAQLNDASARFATLLQIKGVRPGDRVALVMPNITGFPVAYYGILRCGGVVVPMNPLLKAREIAFTLRDSGSRIVVTSPRCADEVATAAAESGPTAWSPTRRRSTPWFRPPNRCPRSPTGRRPTLP